VARASAAAPLAPAYSVHPGVAMVRKMVAELKEKTGRTYPQWLAHIRAKGPGDPKAARTWLREEGVSSMLAYWLAERALGADGAGGMAWDEDPEAYLRGAPAAVDAMFAGGKAGLRAAYDAVAAYARTLGADVQVCPCRTIVPFYRKRVFLEAKPAAAGRLELRMAPGVAATARLREDRGSQGNERLDRTVSVATAAEVDAEVKEWIRLSYEADAPGAKRAPVAAVKAPKDLAAAMAKSAKARATFDALPPGARRDMVAWVEAAKQAETRERRVARVVEALAAGKKRIY
jgi:hypothetical protein